MRSPLGGALGDRHLDAVRVGEGAEGRADPLEVGVDRVDLFAHVVQGSDGRGAVGEELAHLGRSWGGRGEVIGGDDGEVMIMTVDWRESSSSRTRKVGRRCDVNNCFPLGVGAAPRLRSPPSSFARAVSEPPCDPLGSWAIDDLVEAERSTGGALELVEPGLGATPPAVFTPVAAAGVLFTPVTAAGVGFTPAAAAAVEGVA